MSLKPKRVDFQAKWQELEETIKAVITLNYVPRPVWNDRFTDIYSLCVAHPEPHVERLYQETKKFLDTHVKKQLEHVKNSGEENFLGTYFKLWQQYSKGIEYLHLLYQYLNTQHIKKQKLTDAELTYGALNLECQEQMKEVEELGFELWRRNMIEPLKDNLVSLLLEGIRCDRTGQSLYNENAATLHGVIHSFVAVEEHKKKNPLELYETVFEEPFLRATGDHYRSEASRLLQECTVSQYMEKVLQKRDEENLRARKFLHPSSYSKVTTECEARMVSDHLSVLHAECGTMVAQERVLDLSHAYSLLRSVPGGLPVLTNHVYEHIKAQGLAAMQDFAQDVGIQFVEAMLNVHRKYKAIIEKVFHNDQLFTSALDRACAAVVNFRASPKQPCKAPELLAKYCDSLLKKSAKGVSENEVDDKLSASITIFKYIDDKDVFQKFYARFLAKRLIHQQSQSMDAEETMINRLKQACGYEFTNKLHRMFTDMSVSNDLNNKFLSFLRESTTDLGVGFSIYVLQAGAWPLGQNSPTEFALPQELEKSVQKFEDFYRSHFSGRKLTWLHHLCQGELKLCYLKRTYIITLQTFQMAVLLLFEKSDVLSCKELQEATKLAPEHFARHLQSLLDCKLLVLDQESCQAGGSTEVSAVPGTEVAPKLDATSLIRLNLDYSNKRTKFRITAAVVKEPMAEIEATHASVDEDRKLYLQATIVRIMKARKVLRHNALIQEVLSQSKARFAPPISLIKKCIESLIDKQYLERTPNSAEEYSYVA